MTESALVRLIPRWLWFTLATSLALNAAAAGLLGGLALRDRHGGDNGAVTLRHVMRDSPDELRRRARAVFSEQRAAFDALRRETAAAQSRVADVAAREPFDAAALDEALTQLRAAQNALAALRHKVLAQVIAAAPRDTRAVLARRLSETRDRGRRDRETDGTGRSARDELDR